MVNRLEFFHNGGQIKYSSVLMLISLSSLAATSKFQKNICFKMRAVGPINVQKNVKEVTIYESGPSRMHINKFHILSSIHLYYSAAILKSVGSKGFAFAVFAF